MNAPNPTKAELSAPSTGAPIITAGTLPARHATVTAEVLFRLLGYEHMTGMEAVFDASTTRLAAVIHYLETAYGWTIARHDKVVGCKDGRVAFVSEYWIDPEVITLAAGAADWRQKVCTARSALRAKAALAQTLATRANDAARRRKQAHQSGQYGLFEGVAIGASMGDAK